MSKETKVGVFAFTGVVLLLVFITILGDIRFGRKFIVNIKFNNIGGITEGTNVRIKGYDVGVVKKISIVDDYVLLKCEIHKKVNIYKDATAKIVQPGIIGTRYIEIEQGNVASGLLENGGSINGRIYRTFDEIVDSIMEGFEGVGEVFKGDSLKKLSSAFSRLDYILQNVEGSIRSNPDAINDILSNLKNITGELNDVIRGKKAEFDSIIKNIDAASRNLAMITESINKGEGTIGTLVKDTATAESVRESVKMIRETAKSAERVFKRIALIDTYWSLNFRYDATNSISKADAGLKIVPSPGKFYKIQVSNIREKEVYEKSNTITFLVGRSFNGAEVAAGAFRSKFGVTGSYLYKSLGAGFDAYDFESTPRYNLKAIAKIIKPVGIEAGFEDLTVKNFFHAGIFINARDEDLAYLLGLIGLARP